MGVVYEAYDRERKMRVALKTLRRVEPAGLWRLKQEFRAVSDVSHPNLISLYELVSSQGQWFFTMELLDAIDFLTHVRRTTPGSASPQAPPQSFDPSLSGPNPTETGDGPTGQRAGASSRHEVIHPPADARALRAALRQLVEGVQALHDSGHLHRDIKPSNVLVTGEGRVVLLDFGLVIDADDEAREPVGTPAYMAPELAGAGAATEASDWYSVGVMLYEALTGRSPFGGGAESLRLKETAEPPSPRTLRPSAPDDLSALCMELLRPTPEHRPSGHSLVVRVQGETTSPRVSPTRRDPEARTLVGRDSPLAALRTAYEKVKSGGNANLLVAGPSGVGKTALVKCFLDRIREESDVVVLVGRCYERESVPYEALDSLVDALCQFLIGLPQAEAAALVPRDVAALERVFPVLQRVESFISARRQAPVTSEPLELRRRAFSALRELLTRLAERRPLVLFVDDLQWGDIDSAPLLNDLIQPPDPPALLFLGCYRAEEASRSDLLQLLLGAGPPPRLGAARWETLTLGQLDPAESLSLARLQLGTSGRQGQAELIARESGGSPYFVHELVRFAIGEGEGRREAGEKLSLEAVIQRRLARLAPKARELIELLAVAAEPLTREVAMRAVGLSDAEMMTLLRELRALHLVRVSGTRDQDLVEPYHDRLREAVAASLLPAVRLSHHRRLACVIQDSANPKPEVLATHLRAIGENQEATAYAIRAGDRAAEALAFDRAADLYRMALDLRGSGGPSSRDLQVKLAESLVNAGRGAEAAGVYVEATVGAPPAVALELKRRAAVEYLRSGRVREGLAVLETVVGAVGMSLPSTSRSALVSLLAGRLRVRWRGFGFRRRDAAELPAERLAQIDICWSASVGLGMIDNLRGADFQARHFLLALSAGEPVRVAQAFAMEAAYQSIYAKRGWPRTRKALQLAEALASELNRPDLAAWAMAAAGLAHYQLGHFRVARDLTAEAVGTMRGKCTGVAWEIATAELFRLWALFRLGGMGELVQRVRGLVDEARERGDLYAEANLKTGVPAVAWLASDDPDGGEREVDRAMAFWPKGGFHLQHMGGVLARTQIDLYRGNAVTAYDRVRAAYAALRRSGLLSATVVRIESRELRARSALASALVTSGKDRAALLRVAERDARAISRERTTWGDALADLLRGGIAAVRADRDQAAGCWTEAERGFSTADMALHVAIARRRLGELRGDDGGRKLVADADEWMTAEGVKNPRRFAAMLAPECASLACK
jgi:eukaryotic-like serine/threonine-protein kinase